MQAARVQRGMRVVDRDGRRIGRVIRVGEEELVLQSGLLRRRKYVARRDQVSDVRGQEVILSLTTAELGRVADERGTARAHDAGTHPHTSGHELGVKTERAEAERREDRRAEQRMTDDGASIRRPP